MASRMRSAFPARSPTTFSSCTPATRIRSGSGTVSILPSQQPLGFLRVVVAVRPPCVLFALLCVFIAAPAATARAAPPPNDGPDGATVFEPVTAADGSPRDFQALADLTDASPDPGVPRCLGPASFQRTAWFRVPAMETPQDITVEAAGRTLAVADLAAFVQPAGVLAPLRRQPNACSGVGAGAGDAAEEPTSGVTLHVPARRSVLIQAGHRGAAGPPGDEQLVLSLDARPLPLTQQPAGDVAGARTPRARATGRRSTLVDVAHSTITEDEPADPVCPSLGSVWRRLVPKRSGPQLITARGRFATTLAVYSGRLPTADTELDCVNRVTTGEMQMNVRARRGRTLWVRIGSDDAPGGARVKLRVENGANRFVVDGGPGGFDPPTGGPAGGLPSSCERSRPARARVRGPRLRGGARGAIVPVQVAVRGSAICDVEAELVRGGHVYATGVATRLHGRATLRLLRTRAVHRGRYRLRVTAIDELGRRVPVRSNVKGKLT